MSNSSEQKIINKYLENKLSNEQIARLETWYLLKAEENESFDVPVDYENVQSKIWSKILVGVAQPVTEASPKVKKLNHTKKTWIAIGIAASILLLAGISYFFILTKNDISDRFVIEKQKDLPAGENKATLTLSDGRVINLNHDAPGIIGQEAGVEITKATDGTLVYKVLEGKLNTTGFNTIATPVGGQYAVILPDGSKVWLNAGSSLKYPTRFAPTGRKVTLTGEGYFEITHQRDKNGKIPFTVSVFKGSRPTEEVQVLGTHFNINAYTNEPSVKTTLLQGSVSISLNDGKTALLKPGQEAELDNQNLNIQQADTEMATAWKYGEFVFREDLRSVLRKVARWYDVEIIYENSAPQNLTLGGWMSRSNSISEVLNHIQLTGKVHFKLEGRRVIVSN